MLQSTKAQRDFVMVRNAVVLALRQFCTSYEIANIMGLGLYQVHAHTFHGKHSDYTKVRRERYKQSRDTNAAVMEISLQDCEMEAD